MAPLCLLYAMDSHRSRCNNRLFTGDQQVTIAMQCPLCRRDTQACEIMSSHHANGRATLGDLPACLPCSGLQIFCCNAIPSRSSLKRSDLAHNEVHRSALGSATIPRASSSTGRSNPKHQNCIR